MLHGTLQPQLYRVVFCRIDINVVITFAQHFFGDKHCKSGISFPEENETIDLWFGYSYLAGGGLAAVLGGDRNGGLAGLHARYLTVGINGGDFRLIRFPRYILVGGAFWKDSSGKGFCTSDLNGSGGFVKCHTGDANDRRSGLGNIFFTTRPEMGRQQNGCNQQSRMPD